MPHLMNVGRVRTRALATAIAVLGAIAPAAHAETPATGSACPSLALSTPFMPWSDASNYGMVPGASAEAGKTGMDFTGGATIAAGNEPWFITASTDKSSFSLPSGSSLTSRVFCIDQTYPYFRFFLRNTAATTGTLCVDLLYLDAKGVLQTKSLASLSAKNSAWAVSNKISLPTGLVVKQASGLAPIALRFRASGGAWSIDDIYVDPFRRG